MLGRLNRKPKFPFKSKIINPPKQNTGTLLKSLIRNVEKNDKTAIIKLQRLALDIPAQKMQAILKFLTYHSYKRSIATYTLRFLANNELCCSLEELDNFMRIQIKYCNLDDLAEFIPYYRQFHPNILDYLIKITGQLKRPELTFGIYASYREASSIMKRESAIEGPNKRWDNKYRFPSDYIKKKISANEWLKMKRSDRNEFSVPIVENILKSEPPLNQHSMNLISSCLLEAQNLELLTEVLDYCFLNNYNESFAVAFGNILKLLRNNNRKQFVVNILKSVPEQQIECLPGIVSVIICELVKVDEIELALQYYEKYKNVNFHESVYHTMLNYYTSPKIDDLNEAQAWYRILIASGNELKKVQSTKILSMIQRRHQISPALFNLANELYQLRSEKSVDAVEIGPLVGIAIKFGNSIKVENLRTHIIESKIELTFPLCHMFLEHYVRINNQEKIRWALSAIEELEPALENRLTNPFMAHTETDLPLKAPESIQYVVKTMVNYFMKRGDLKSTYHYLNLLKYFEIVPNKHVVLAVVKWIGRFDESEELISIFDCLIPAQSTATVDSKHRVSNGTFVVDFAMKLLADSFYSTHSRQLLTAVLLLYTNRKDNFSALHIAENLLSTCFNDKKIEEIDFPHDVSSIIIMTSLLKIARNAISVNPNTLDFWLDKVEYHLFRLLDNGISLDQTSFFVLRDVVLLTGRFDLLQKTLDLHCNNIVKQKKLPADFRIQEFLKSSANVLNAMNKQEEIKSLYAVLCKKRVGSRTSIINSFRHALKSKL